MEPLAAPLPALHGSAGRAQSQAQPCWPEPRAAGPLTAAVLSAERHLREGAALGKENHRGLRPRRAHRVSASGCGAPQRGAAASAKTRQMRSAARRGGRESGAGAPPLGASYGERAGGGLAPGKRGSGLRPARALHHGWNSEAARVLRWELFRMSRQRLSPRQTPLAPSVAKPDPIQQLPAYPSTTLHIPVVPRTVWPLQHTGTGSVVSC